MFIINHRNNKIIMTKGDTGTFNVKAYTLDAKHRPLKDTDVLTLTVRESENSQAPLFALTADSNGSFYISPSTTANVNPGLYVYDCQLATDGEIYTIIPCSFFELKNEITH